LNATQQGWVRIASVLLCAIGSIPFLYFFGTVDAGTPLPVLLIGVALLSTSCLLSLVTVEDNSKNYHFIFFLYFSTLIFFTMFRIRFDSLPYGDVLAEYRTAQNTLEQGTWLLERSEWERYLSSISVSLTPAIVSQITGLDLLFLFKYGYMIVTAILPVALYYLVDEVFANAKVSATSSVLFSQLYFNHRKLMNLTRQQVTEVHLVLFLLVLFKIAFRKRVSNRSYGFLLLVFLISLITGHYTINYFALAIVLAMFLASFVIPYLPQRITNLFQLKTDRIKHIVNQRLFLLIIVLSLVWWSTAQFTNFQSDIVQQITNLFFKTSQETYYQVGFIGSSPLGPIVTAWVDIQAGSAAIGFLYVVFRYRKGHKMVYWLIASAVMFAAMAFWLTPGQSYTGAYPDRIYIIGYLFFASFTAYILHRFWEKKYARILFVAFILLNLPMNMFLPAYSEYVHYNVESNVPATKNIKRMTPHTAELVLQAWINDNLPPETTSVHSYFFGNINLFYIRDEVMGASMPLNASYVFLDHLTLNHGLWRTGELGYDVLNLTAVLNERGLVYNSGQAALATPMR
jgi:uncharacterized membrane protein